MRIDHVIRLMQCPPLSPLARLGEEDRLCREFANALRIASVERRLHAVWTHPANELAGTSSRHASVMARTLGLVTGTPDYLFLAKDRSLALEAKARRGHLTSCQRDFAAWCAEMGVPHRIFRKAGEGLAILAEHGLLTP